VGIGLLALAFLGRPLLMLFLGRSGSDNPQSTHEGEHHQVTTGDGTLLNVEVYGPKEGPPIIMTHGWGLDSSVWYYAKKELGQRYRLIVWDLPGLGASGEPPDKRYDIEKLAGYLALLFSFAGERPVFLLGHSIGGMITQTFCRRFPDLVRDQVRGLILVHTTFTNAVETTFLKGWLRALQTPILTPLMYLTIALSPLVRLTNWLSYLNGSLLLTTAFTGFAGTQSREQLDFMTRFMLKASPAVQARGNLAIFKFDERATLPAIPVPTLVIVGDIDRVTIPEAGHTIASEIPQSTLITLAPANHGGFIEHHARFAEVVTTFIEAHQVSHTHRSGI
jgi:pimeloyl-ACP methyl ester carboxylesterase